MKTDVTYFSKHHRITFENWRLYFPNHHWITFQNRRDLLCKTIAFKILFKRDVSYFLNQTLLNYTAKQTSSFFFLRKEEKRRKTKSLSLTCVTYLSRCAGDQRWVKVSIFLPATYMQIRHTADWVDWNKRSCYQE